MKKGLLETAMSPLTERSRRRKVRPATEESRESKEPSKVPSSPAMSFYSPSKSIPIAKALKRTVSELQLMEDEAMADFRDYCMYLRIVNGIKHRENESLFNIIRTRQLPVRDSSPSFHEECLRYANLPPLEAASCLSSTPLGFEEDVLPEDEGIFFLDM